MESIRLSQCIADVPLQKRLSILENLYHQSDNTYSVHELCEALNVARGTFYNHIFRRADRSQRDQEQAQLMLLVQQAFDDSGQRYGAEKIRITLAESGIRVSTKRIAAIMQELDLRSIRLDSKKQFDFCLFAVLICTPEGCAEDINCLSAYYQLILLSQ